MSKTYIGIDPGTNGGIAVLYEGGRSVDKMPPTYPDIYEYIRDITICHEDITCVLEDVGYGIPGQSSKATATFAEHIGMLKMALYALRVRTELVKPTKWMKEYSNTIGKSSDCASKTEWKNKLKTEAQRLFPEEKVTLWGADALLLAEYGRRKQL